MVETVTPYLPPSTAAQAIISVARKVNLSPADTVAVVRSVTNLGPNVGLTGNRIAVANATGCQMMAGADPAAVVTEIEHLYR